MPRHGIRPACSVNGCSKPHKGHGYCPAHLDRYRRGVDVTALIKQRGPEMCSEPDCELEHYALGFCKSHYSRMRSGASMSPAVTPRPRGERLGYAGAHGRVRAVLGEPENYQCIDCGQPAQEWAYDHLDEHELLNRKGQAYSDNPIHYQPRCISCHRKFDRPAA